MSIADQADVATLLGGNLSVQDTAILTLVFSGSERLVKKFLGYSPEYSTGVVEVMPMGGRLSPSGDVIGWEMVGDRAVAFTGDDESYRNLSLGLRRPIRTIESIYENQSAWDTAGGDFPVGTLLAATEYQIDYNEKLNGTPLGWSGMVIRRSGSWSRVPRTIQITYSGGLTAGEITSNYPELKLAVYDTVIKKFNEYLSWQGAGGNSGGAVIAERLGDYSVQYDQTSAAYATGLMTDLPQSAKELLWDFVSMRKFLQ
jgi:hypothetical protein